MPDHNKIRILTFVSYYLPGYKAGGPIRTIENLVEHLGDEISFQIVTRDCDLGENVAYRNIEPDKWITNGKASIYYVKFGKLTYSTFKRILDASKCDVVYLNSFFDPSFAIKPLFFLRFCIHKHMPIIIAPKGEFSAGALAIKGIKKRLYITLAKKMGLIKNVIWQASSNYEGADIKNQFSQLANVMVASDLFLPLNIKKKSVNSSKEANKLKVVFLSRISKSKNLFGALEILKQIKKGVVDFDIYGPIEDRSYWNLCKEAMSKMPQNVNVSYRGIAKSDGVCDIFSNYNLFLFPTWCENFGHVIIESLASGCPVLISDRTPWRGLSEKGIGWDIPLENTVKFCDVIAHCIQMNPTEFKAMSDKAISYALSFCSNNELKNQNKALFEHASRLYYNC